MNWCEKYKPIHSKEVVGQTTAIRKIQKFLTAFSNNTSNKKNVCMLIGKSGIGKTLLANLVLHEMGYAIKHVDENHPLEKILNTATFFRPNKETVILYESMYMEKLASDIPWCKKSRQPILFLCHTDEKDQWKELIKHAEVIYMRIPTIEEQKGFLETIFRKENIPIHQSQIIQYCEQSGGDMRLLCINAQLWKSKAHSEGKDQMETNVFTSMAKIFDYRENTLKKIRYIIDIDYLSELLFYNYPHVKIPKNEHHYEMLQQEFSNANSSDIFLQDLYKLRIYEHTTHNISETDIIKKVIHQQQHYELLSLYQYQLVSSYSECFGILMENDIKYTKPKSTLKFNYP